MGQNDQSNSRVLREALQNLTNRQLFEEIRALSNDINALNTSIGNLANAITVLNTGLTEILQINAQSPAPIDYTQQVNAINAALQQVQNDTSLIDAVPAIANLPKQTTSQEPNAPDVPVQSPPLNNPNPQPAVTPAVIDANPSNPS